MDTKIENTFTMKIHDQCLTFSDEQKKVFMAMLNYILRCVQYGSPFELEKL